MYYIKNKNHNQVLQKGSEQAIYSILAHFIENGGESTVEPGRTGGNFLQNAAKYLR
jgi:hypothetical protein